MPRALAIVLLAAAAVLLRIGVTAQQQSAREQAASDWAAQTPLLPEAPEAGITPGRVPWLVDLAGAGALPDAAIPQAAAATRAVIDDPVPAELAREHYTAESLAGLEPFRSQQQSRCGDCAPAARPLPERVFPGPVSLSNQAEAHRRSTVTQDADALVRVAVTIREGGTPEEAVWQTPAQAGLAALELGRRGNTADLPVLLKQAVSGPTASDRIAALYAADRLAGPEELAAAAQDPELAEGAGRVARIRAALGER